MSNNLAPVYPFDPTGQLASNLITNELQILTPANGIDYHFLVPISGPYFEESLVVTITDPATNVETPLTVGVDYYPSHWFISASRACASNIFGSVTFLDLTLAGTVKLKYQSIGGSWTISSAEIATILADTLHNPRITAWEEVVLSYQIVNAPNMVAGQLYLIAEVGDTDFTQIGATSNAPGTQFLATGPGTGTGNAVSMSFPPTPHQWNLVDMVGMSDVVTAINSVADVIMQQLSVNANVLNTQIINYSSVPGTLVQTDTLLTAIGKLDGNDTILQNQINLLNQNVTGGVLSVSVNTTNNLVISTGVNSDGTFTAPTNTSYLNNTTSLFDSDLLLDTALSNERTRAVNAETVLNASIQSLSAVTVKNNGNTLPLDNGNVTSSKINIPTTNPNQVIDSFAIASYRSAKYLVQIESTSGYQLTEILVIHNGVSPYIVETSDVTSTGSYLATFSGGINNGNFELSVTPLVANLNFSLIRTTITVYTN